MTDGIYDNITIKDYHANGTHLSATQIKIAKKSLKELDWTRRGLIVPEYKSHNDFGNAFELALTNPVEFSEKVRFYDVGERPEPEKAMNSKANIAWKAEFYKTGGYVVEKSGEESYEYIKCMLESCYADKTIQGLIRNTETQLSLFWTDDQTGLQLKTRPDICKRKKNIVVNLKTTIDGSPKGFSRDLAKYDYPLQASVEMAGCLATGLMEKIDNYFWLVVEKVPPFNATIYEFDKEDWSASDIELEYLVRKIKKAKEEKLFPGYSDRSDNPYGILKAEIPMYYKMANV